MDGIIFFSTNEGNNNNDQIALLKELNLRKEEADQYKKYCKN